MARKGLYSLSAILRERRGHRGLREVAKEIGTSTPTLSRVENGKMPDLDTFGKLCRWAAIDPGELLGIRRPPPPALRNQPEPIDAAMVAALANTIIRSQRMSCCWPESEC